MRKDTLMIMNRLKKLYPLLIIAIFLFSHPIIQADAAYKNNLEVNIDVSKSEITGISKIGVTAGQGLLLHKGQLGIIYIKLDNQHLDFDEYNGTIKILPDDDGVIEISYRGIFKDNVVMQDVIDERGISLTRVWYPKIPGLCYYDLKVTLPKGYEAISEAEEIKKIIKSETVEFYFHFPYLLDSISLVAANRYNVVKDNFNDVGIYAYFFHEDLSLAKTYIEFTKKYLKLYEDLIGAYPYRRFSIVENFLPTGYSMPTFTLLGDTVVRLPFIVETSLGHEILHQWFGNLVYADYESGNWVEGLTTYLADHLYKEQKGKGWEYRKQILIDYKSYVTAGKDFPLKLFTSRVDTPTRAVGYGKAAMVFHMLRNVVGDKVFFESLKDVIRKNRFGATSWDDLRVTFERLYGQDLSWFFSQWIDKDGLPELELENLEIKQLGSKFRLHFQVNHKREFYKLNLPIAIYSTGNVIKKSLRIDNQENSFTFLLPGRPEKIIVDEDYHIARELAEDEFPPVIARLLGDEKLIIVLPSDPDKEEMYQGIIDEFKKKGASIKRVKDIIESDIKSSSVAILDFANPLIGRLYGKLGTGDAGFSILVRENPWNSQKVIGIFNGKSKDEVDAAFRKIFHYGKYSKLLFDNGRNIGKEIHESQRGIVMELRQEAAAVDISSINTLSDVINSVSDKKIIYVGEVHNVFAHHAVQLDVITGIYRKNRKVAIGMEMFQKPFQKTLDDFIAGRIDEKNFLKRSGYFKRWGLDYNLYKPILDFARMKKIPVIALNLEREIIEKVSKSGIDSLSDEERKELPSEMDFSDTEYRERLKEIFRMHKDFKERNFDYFFQSQILWDETMSQSVEEFLQKNPDYQIVVLVGQGHLRYGAGIPKRTYRRNGYDYAIILTDERVEKDIADYIVFPKHVEGITAPKLMIFLKDEDSRIKIADFPEDSLSEKAGLKVGDIILFMDKAKISSIEDIKIHLHFKKKGDALKVKILRKEEDQDKVMEIEVVFR